MRDRGKFIVSEKGRGIKKGAEAPKSTLSESG